MAAALLDRFSFVKMLLMWRATVFSLMPSASAIARLVLSGRHESQDLDLPRGQIRLLCLRRDRETSSAKIFGSAPSPAKTCLRRPAPSPRRPRHQALGRSDRSARDSGPLRTAPRGGTTRSTRDEAPGARLSADLRRGGPPRWPDRKRPAGGGLRTGRRVPTAHLPRLGRQAHHRLPGLFQPRLRADRVGCGDPASHREDCERLRWLHRSASARAEVERGQDGFRAHLAASRYASSALLKFPRSRWSSAS